MLSNSSGDKLCLALSCRNDMLNSSIFSGTFVAVKNHQQMACFTLASIFSATFVAFKIIHKWHVSRINFLHDIRCVKSHPQMACCAHQFSLQHSLRSKSSLKTTLSDITFCNKHNLKLSAYLPRRPRPHGSINWFLRCYQSFKKVSHRCGEWLHKPFQKFTNETILDMFQHLYTI